MNIERWDCEGRQDGKDKVGQCHHKDLGNGKAASQNGVGRNPSPHKRSDIIALLLELPPFQQLLFLIKINW